MSKRAYQFLADNRGTVGTQIGLGIALAFELVFVIADWAASLPT